jgi:hypothetical protein
VAVGLRHLPKNSHSFIGTLEFKTLLSSFQGQEVANRLTFAYSEKENRKLNNPFIVKIDRILDKVYIEALSRYLNPYMNSVSQTRREVYNHFVL